MKTVRGETEELKFNSGTVVTIGNFDGVHKGHKKLLETLVLKSKNNGLTSLVYTFSEHPQKSKAITDTEEKSLKISLRFFKSQISDFPL